MAALALVVGLGFLPAAGLGQAPANDLLASSQSLAGPSLAVQGSNAGATREAGEPEHAGNSGGSSVWWRWTAPETGWVELDLAGSDFDTLLAVYTGPSVGGLQLVAANDDGGDDGTSQLRFPSHAGVTYRIAVDGFNSGAFPAAGNIRMTLALTAGPLDHPLNDDFAAATRLDGSQVQAVANTANASREPQEPLHAGRPGQASVWYGWTAPASGPVRIDTAGSGIDTLLAVYTGPTLETLTLVAGNDDAPGGDNLVTSAVEFGAVGGQLYWIAVDGYDGAAGDIRLQIAGPSAPATDLMLDVPTLMPDGSLLLVIRGSSGRISVVELGETLSGWTELGRVTNSVAGSASLSTPTSAGSLRFYRARDGGAP